ncbi:FAD-dependent oxidoreductase [Microbacterium profundi]|uniref:flavin monoamine oxidase family protein n=1 Tax=Microbacterium profundi TaxID=450380 RepID=UPI001F16605D|nr:FAD-dependent oxidoreductase [Microbacterium profundi]MCE7483280.1 FAD-dependent oxidoreductase [Microbacterium profundi]
MTRRELLIGAGAGALGVLLVSCTPEPTPTRTPTRTPTPLPTTKVPAPAASMRSAWATDPFSRGAVSYTRIGVQSATRETLAEPVQGRVYFAGEATDADNPGTMRGAIHSGESAAMRLRATVEAGERIAVIGAGLAGATVAADLADLDVEVTVFEARDRVGGRIHSQVEDDWPLPVQLGGWLVGADDDTALAETVELATALWRSPEGAIEPPANAAMETAIAAARALPADVSLAEALTATGADPEEPTLAALLAYLATTSGADAEKLSAWFPPALPLAVSQGFIGDLTEFVQERLGDAQLTLSSPVTRIAYDDSGVSLRLGTGESTSFDRVVVTVPLGVLQREGIEFAPPLPFTHRGALNALGMGHVETIWLRYDEPFWDTEATIWHVVGDGLGGGGLVREDTVPVRTWINLLPVTGENLLVGIVGGDDAEKFAELEEEGALLSALTSLELFLPSAATG